MMKVGKWEVGNGKWLKQFILFGFVFSTYYLLLTTSCLYASWSNHVVISQFSTGSSRSTKDEFIELYNPTAREIDISEWRVQFKPTDEGKSWVTRAVIPTDEKIPAYGFFLIANSEPNYSGLQADLTKNSPYGLLSEEGSIRIIDYDGEVIDKVGYGLNATEYEKSPVENDGDSLARRNYGFDTDNNKADFVATKKRSPHNSDSIPEKPSSLEPVGSRRPSKDRLTETSREKELEGDAIYREAKTDWRNNKLFDCIEKLKRIVEMDQKNSSAQSDLQDIPKKIKEDLEKKNLVGRDQFYGEAVLYYIQSDYKSAAVNLKKILLLTPEDIEVRQWYEKISALVPSEKIEETQPEIVPQPVSVEKEEPIKIKPKPSQKKDESSAPVVSKSSAAKRDFEKAEEHYNNGLKEYSSGYISKAIEEWESCLKYNPNHERAKNALAKARKILKK
ncbi:MAG: lamin tail domain-containing protein [Elusimicrobia bacterium]|nr:lamin tail domain-containing protein [Elusimicrobiota bacterium]